MIRFGNRITYGKSAPPPEKGLHLSTRHRLYDMPFKTPYFCNASIVYSEQLGMCLQRGYRLKGASCWYKRTRKIRAARIYLLVWCICLSNLLNLMLGSRRCIAQCLQAFWQSPQCRNDFSAPRAPVAGTTV
jgi:hypothetical protein